MLMMHSVAISASRAAQTATLERIIPEASLEPLLANLVHGVECMHAQGRLGSASRGSLLSFMALVDLVLAGQTQAKLSRGPGSGMARAIDIVGPVVCPPRSPRRM